MSKISPGEIRDLLLKERDSMSAGERREFLLSKNFRVAGASFFGSFSIPVFSMLDIGSRWFENDRRFFIDLESGAWQQAGRVWDIWPAGPWFTAVDPFFESCERSGIVWTGEKSEKGTRRGEFRGVSVLASESARSLYVEKFDQLVGIGLFLELVKDRATPVEAEQLRRDVKPVESPAINVQPAKRKQSLLF